MSEASRWSNPDYRWLLLSHALFAVTLVVPTVLVLLDDTPVAARATTAAIALAFAAWYAWFAMRPQRLEQPAVAVLHAVGLLAFYTVLSTRGDTYFLLLYSLLPLLFSTLPRGLAVLGTVGLIVLPITFDGGLEQLLRDRGAVFNLLATVSLGLVITAVIEALGRTTERQQRTIGELEAARSEVAQLLDRTRQDLHARSALARTGHALIAARTPAAVTAALATELADHRMGVRGVALLVTLDDDPPRALVVEAVAGTVGPAVGTTVRLPRPVDERSVCVVSAEELTGSGNDVTPAVHAVALLPLHTSDASDTADGGGDGGRQDDVVADLLWLSLGAAAHGEATIRDLSTIATETALALSNLRLAARAAERGRVTGVLAERQRLAHEIHDTLAQGFTSIVTQLEAADQVLATAPDVAREHLDRARRTARDSLGEARRTVEALRPQPLERAALSEALRDVVDRWRAGHGEPIAVSITVDGQPSAAPPDTDAALLRVAQEALTNVARHAGATRVDLTLSYLDDLVLLDIADDGVGFAADAVTGGSVEAGGYGLLAMRERMLGVGGELVVESAPGDGTTVAASIPLPGRNGLRQSWQGRAGETDE
jgi:signal transduction histidine kinase